MIQNIKPLFPHRSSPPNPYPAFKPQDLNRIFIQVDCRGGGLWDNPYDLVVVLLYRNSLLSGDVGGLL
jgi:hypothetical protein